MAKKDRMLSKLSICMAVFQFFGSSFCMFSSTFIVNHHLKAVTCLLGLSSKATGLE